MSVSIPGSARTGGTAPAHGSPFSCSAQSGPFGCFPECLQSAPDGKDSPGKSGTPGTFPWAEPGMASDMAGNKPQKGCHFRCPDPHPYPKR